METMTKATVVLNDGRTVSIDELGGLAEVAETFHWNQSTLTTWVNRYEDCPAPVAKLRRGSLYVVRDWEAFTPPGED